MRGKTLAALALSTAVLLAVILLVKPVTDSPEAVPHPISVPLVMQYYDLTYNPSLKLFAETPYSNTYYVESDNLLAVIALKYLNDTLWEEVWNNIRVNLTLSPYLVLLGVHNFTWEFRTPSNDQVWKDIYITNFTNSSHPFLAWYEYADTSFLYSIYELENGNITLAEDAFSATVNDFWDGYGFRDEAFNGYYSSYKLALAVIAWKYILKYNETFAMQYYPMIEKIYQISSHLQSSSGGYFTCYEVANGTIVPEGNVNTETTSLFVIAFLMPPYNIT